MSCKKTNKSVATKASKALRDGRTSATTKSIAGSALSQRQPKHIHKKRADFQQVCFLFVIQIYFYIPMARYFHTIKQIVNSLAYNYDNVQNTTF